MKKKIVDSSNDIDRLLGKRLRNFRIKRNLTQSVLGRAIGVTAQQLQKYEKADNRMSASRLCLIAQYLQIPVAHFFYNSENIKNQQNDHLNDNIIIHSGFNINNSDNIQINECAEENEGFTFEHDKHENLESTRLIHAYYNIADNRTRSSVYHLIKSLAKNDAEKKIDHSEIKKTNDDQDKR